VVADHRFGAAVTEHSDEFGQATEQAVNCPGRYACLGSKAADRECFGSATPDDRARNAKQVPTAHLIATLDNAGSLGERARAAVQAGPTRGTSDLPNAIRAAHGPGWALAGDAGLVMDPLTGLGIGHALRDAELLSTAIVQGLGGTRDLNDALRRYQKQQDHQTTPAFNWTIDLAHMRGANEIEERLFTTIGADQTEASNFFGMLTGIVPMRSFFAPAHLVRMIGVKDFLRLLRARSR
jgi:2-polyprenyl-6-methoxyphenol hydroxylase-like FAD-dependent oxidoreductase